MTDEPRKPSRRKNGTFDEGQSGNLKGRPTKDRRITPPETIRDRFSDVSGFFISANINGQPHKMSLLEANYMTLGLAGAAGDKAAAKAFVALAMQVAEQELDVMERMKKYLQGMTPAYLEEKDPVVRAEKREAWFRAVAEATGDREKTTDGLGRKAPKRWPRN